MYSPKLISRLLSKLSSDLSGQKCGIDDDELKQIANDLESVDCGLSDDELKRSIAKFNSLPTEKKAEIAEKIINRKLYEEDIIARYGISRPTMYRWIEKGKLPPFHSEGGKKNYLFAIEADEAVSKYESDHK